ncbi:polysaccharide biosynthesis/export family protein [Segnochrobactraceae bacterium EtOH-i3]
MARTLALLLTLTTLTGCAALPGDGPSGADIKTSEIQSLSRSEFLLVDITPEVANVAGQYRARDFANTFSLRSAGVEQPIGVGDRLAVNIWEAGENGLFSSGAAKATSIQTVVDSSGRIFVPYVGAVKASGRSVDAVRMSIEDALGDRAIQPQVQVLVADNLANSAMVMGDVVKPGRYPITPNGVRVLDLVAIAGGSKANTYDTVVTLRRGNRTASAVMEDLFDNPANNVLLAPNDSLLLASQPRSFTVFGATQQTAKIAFQARTVTLAEAIAQSGGLNNMVADPNGVFIFRFEDAAVARAINPEKARAVPAGAKVPTIYRLNMRDPKVFFLARYFEMRDKDVLYVANHPTAELGKFLTIISPALNAWGRVSNISN